MRPWSQAGPAKKVPSLEDITLAGSLSRYFAQLANTCGKITPLIPSFSAATGERSARYIVPESSADHHHELTALTEALDRIENTQRNNLG